MANQQTFSSKWTCTDPDANQYGRQIAETVYQFKEGDSEIEDIDLDDYTSEEIESIINSCGYTLFADKDGNKNIHSLYDDFNWIIAECIFETEKASPRFV